MKHNSTIISLTAASFFALAASANATDLFGSADNHPAPPYSWSGLWVGAMGGYAFSNSDTTYDEGEIDKVDGDYNERDVINIDGLGADGFLGEGQIGYDHQVSSNLLVGVFGGINVSDAEFTASYSVDGADVLTVSNDYEWGGVAGLRLGFIKSPDTLFYLGGGYAYAQLGDTLVNGVKFNTGDNELDGWFGEVGMETRIANNVFLTVSGRYTDYGSMTVFHESELDRNGDTDYKTIETDTDSLAVMVGLKAKLGGF